MFNLCNEEYTIQDIHKLNMEDIQNLIKQIQSEILGMYDNLSDVSGDTVKAVPCSDIKNIFQYYIPDCKEYE